MSKAFDKVSHCQLVDRLHEFGFRGNILKWFSSYLSNRYQQTTVLEATSRQLAVTSGAPQGLLIGPLLFLLHENHLANNVTNSSVAIATFADDTKIFKVIRSISDAASLQQDLSHFESGSSEANLHLNVEKCKLLRITRKYNKVEYHYKLKDKALINTNYERDLGVWTSSNLIWTKHIECQCTQANKMLGYIRRSTLEINSTLVRRTLYLTLVRSQSCYASQVWAPQSIISIKRIERIQRWATKFILDLPFFCDISYNQRLEMLNLLPVCYWHDRVSRYGVFYQVCPRNGKY